VYTFVFLLCLIDDDDGCIFFVSDSGGSKPSATDEGVGGQQNLVVPEAEPSTEDCRETQPVHSPSVDLLIKEIAERNSRAGTNPFAEQGN
jgi:hypothetical protein